MWVKQLYDKVDRLISGFDILCFNSVFNITLQRGAGNLVIISSISWDNYTITRFTNVRQSTRTKIVKKNWTNNYILKITENQESVAVSVGKLDEI